MANLTDNIYAKAKNSAQKYMYDMLLIAGFLIYSIYRFVSISATNNGIDVLYDLAFNFIATLIIWSSRYQSGKLKEKAEQYFKALIFEVARISDSVQYSPHSIELDDWCNDVCVNELTDRRKKVLDAAKIPYDAWESELSNLYPHEIEKHAVFVFNEKQYCLSKKQIKQIKAVNAMRQISDITADSLLNEAVGKYHKKVYGLGKTEKQVAVTDTSTKASKVLTIAIFTAYISFKLSDSLSWDTVIDCLISLLPFFSAVVFGYTAGLGSVRDELTAYHNNRKKYLLRFCNEKKIALPITKEE